MCAQCMATATVAVAGATGTRAWLATRRWSWLTAARLRRATLVLTAAAIVTAGAAGPAAAAGEQLVRGADGSYAFAAPGLEWDFGSGIALAGGSVVWTTGFDGNLAEVRQIDESGVASTVYSPTPRTRSVYTSGLVASPRRVSLLTSTGVFTAHVGERLRRVVGAIHQVRRHSGCRRGLALINNRFSVEPPISMSGDRVLYAQRLKCSRQWRSSRYELVLRNVRTGRVRVLRRGRDTTAAMLAGRYVAWEVMGEPPPPGVRRDIGHRIVVKNLRRNRVAYRTPWTTTMATHLQWPALDADGTLVGIGFGGSDRGRMGWYSPAEPRYHQLPERASVFSGAPMLVAGGRVAFVRKRGAGYELAVSDLEGRTETYATFGDGELADFAFDGRRIAWVTARYRPYAGPQDDGLPMVCGYGTRSVLEEAPIVEVHAVGRSGRLPATALPHVPAPRDPDALVCDPYYD